LKTGEELFNEITGMHFKGEGELFLSQIQKYTKDKLVELKLDSNKEDEKYNFDYHFEKSLKNKSKKVESSTSSDDSSSDDDN
jgi:hypothetical protein